MGLQFAEEITILLLVTGGALRVAHLKDHMPLVHAPTQPQHA
jgi:hypothetical protein